MYEPDDRLVGDPVWELFPSSPPAQEPEGRQYRFWLAAAAGIVAVWFVWPSLSVALACLAVAARDFRTGRRIARSIPDKAGGRVCALFTYAWGTWKAGFTAFALMFATILLDPAPEQRGNPPPAFFATVAASILWLGGMTASAALTAAGLWRAYRAGMRVWVGEGINQARTLLLGMLVVGFTYFVIGPACFMLARATEPAGVSDREDPLPWFIFMGCMFAGPVAILLVLDLVCRRIVADRPARFGPKVPAVGKWKT
jgi:hypothetical protein